MLLIRPSSTITAAAVLATYNRGRVKSQVYHFGARLQQFCPAASSSMASSKFKAATVG